MARRRLKHEQSASPRAVQAFAVRGQSFLLFVTAVCTILLLLLHGHAMLSACRQFLRRRSAARSGLTLPAAAEFPELALGAGGALPTAGDPSAVTVASALDVPEIPWRDERNLRHAAALLVAHGDVAGAVSLLRHTATGAELASALGVSVAERARHALSEAVVAETVRLNEFWAGLDDRQRAAEFAEGSGGDRAAFEQLVLAGTGATPLEELAKALPAHLVFCLAINVRRRLARRGDLPGALIPLLVDGGLPRDCLAVGVPVGSADAGPVAYADARRALARAFHREHVLPRARQVLAEARARLLGADEPTREWYTDVFSADFCEGLAQLEPQEADEVALRLCWRQLPECLRKLWSRRLQAGGGAQGALSLPEYLREESFWLRTVTTPVQAPLLAAVRKHPSWRRELHLFRYAAAFKRVPAIMEHLGADDCAKVIREALAQPLHQERRCLTSVFFEWSRLRSHLSVGEKRPPAFRRSTARAGPPGPGYIAPTWERVPMSRFRTGVDYLAAHAVESDRAAFYRRVDTLYALNRGLALKEPAPGDGSAENTTDR